jgi:hypothetical protein
MTAPGAVLAGIALAVAFCAPAGDVQAIDREIFKDIRDRYEGLALRLRIDLKGATGAAEPNVARLEGIAQPAERAPVLFGSLETVYVQRITREGGSRLGLTVYRSEEEARRLRASAIPGPSLSNPAYDRTLASFARQGSTSVVLELQAGKNDPQGQLDEIETLLDRVFYVKSEPGTEALEDFVRRHTGMPISRLHSLTGLPDDRIRAILKETQPPQAP